MRFNAADVLWGEQPYRQEARSWRSSCGQQQGTDQMVFRLWLSVQSKAGKADVVNKRAWSSWVVFLWSSLQTRHLNSEGCVGAALLLWCGFVEFLSRFVDFGCMWLQPHKNCWRWGVHSFWFSKKAGGKTLPFYLFLSNPELFFSFFFSSLWNVFQFDLRSKQLWRSVLRREDDPSAIYFLIGQIVGAVVWCGSRYVWEYLLLAASPEQCFSSDVML